MRIGTFAALAIVVVLVACQGPSSQPPPPELDDLLAVAPTSAQVGDAVTVTYRGVDGAVDVRIAGIAAAQVGEPTEGEDSTLVVDVLVPVGATGWSSVEVASGDDGLTIAASDRAFFVGTILDSLGNDLQAVQDALDAIEVGGAVLIPAGTYAGNEPAGGLVIDNRLLVGSGEGDTVVEGVTQLSLYARTTSTAGIADLTLAADAATVFGGTIVSTATWDVDPVPVTTSLGRLLVWNATWTGNGAITAPTIDADTLEVTAYGVADGTLGRDASARHMAFEFDGATVILYDVNLSDGVAIGPWTIVDSDIWVQDRIWIYQVSGNLVMRDSRLAQVGDPVTAVNGPSIEVDIDSFDGAIVDSVLTSTGELRIQADDGGNRQIVRSRLRSEGALVLEGDYYGSLLIEDSWLYANDAIDMGRAANLGWVRIAGSTLDADGRVDVYLTEGFSIEVLESTLRSRSDRVYLEVSEGTVVVVDSTIEAATYVDIETEDAGNIDLIASSITAGTYIYLYMDYYGTLTIESSTLSAGTYLNIDPWSGGISQIDIRDSLVEAIQYVAISETVGGDVSIERSTIRVSCEYLDVYRDPGSIVVSDSTLTTVGTLPNGTACAAVGSLDVRLFTQGGMVVLSGATIDAGGSVLVEDYPGGSNAPPSLTTQVGSADMRVDGGSAITAGGAVRIGTAGALEVLASTIDAVGGIVLSSPLLGDIVTTGSTFTPAPVVFTAFP